MYRKSNHNLSKIDLLLKQDKNLFHTPDLGLIWGVSNKNTLYTTIKRYVKKGILISVHKGFYSTKSLEKIDPIALGIGFLHQYAYLSTESVLVEAGVINQEINYLTLVSAVSKKFVLGGNAYLVRKMQDRFLYQTIGMEEGGGYKKASLEKAVVDLLYFNPHYHFDNKNLVDWQKVKFIQKKVGFK